MEDAAYTNIVHKRVLSPAGNARVVVPNGSGSIVFTFPRAEYDLKYIPIATPSWNTSVYCAEVDKLVGSCKFTFGTAPGADSILNVHIMRSES